MFQAIISICNLINMECVVLKDNLGLINNHKKCLIRAESMQKDFENLYKGPVIVKKDCVKFKKTLIVNDHVDIAKSINAHGAHVGMDDLPYNQARKILVRKSIIGVSASNKNEFIKVKNELNKKSFYV